jgi:DNA-binding response OmpR family regulator
VLPSPPTTRSTDPKPAGAVLRGHILLLEDDPSIRDVVTTVLEDEGYVVTTGETLAEAMRLLDQASFDLVITDGFGTLPGDSFAAVMGVVRSAGLTPVVLFSAHTHDLGVAKAAGFHDLITKPFDLDTLVRQVEGLLARECRAVEAFG